MAGHLAAQQAQISINATEITIDEAFVMSVTLSGISGGQVPQPNFPVIKGMQMGQQGIAQNSINGKVSVTFSRSYYAGAPGTYKVPSMSYEFKGAATKSKGLSLKVKKSDGKQQQNRPRNPLEDFFNDPYYSQGQRQQPQQDLKYKSLDAEYFLSVNLDKQSCYIGEQVHGDVVLYVNERDAGKIQVYINAVIEMQQRIKNTGFWQEIIELTEIPAERTQINGKNFVTYTLYKNILFAIKTGNIEFKDIYLDGMKLAIATNASPVARIMRQDTKFEKIKIEAADRKLVVKPLPPTQLIDATMVGKFKLEAKLSQKEIQTGQNLELEVKIAGNGNMAMMADPVIQFPEGFEVYDPNTQFNSKVQGNGLIGDKSWKWSMLPARAGDYDFGPISFYFFDPEKNAYDSLVVPELKVKVTGDDIENQRIGKSGTDQFYESALKSAHQDLNSSHVNSGWMLFAGLGIAGFVAAIGLRRNRKHRSRSLQPTDDSPDDYWSK